MGDDMIDLIGQGLELFVAAPVCFFEGSCDESISLIRDNAFGIARHCQMFVDLP